MLSACHLNTNILIMDVTLNSSIYEKKQYDLHFRDELLKNMRLAIQSYIERAVTNDLKKPTNSTGLKEQISFKQSRLNYEWMIPELYGITLKGVKSSESSSRASLFGKEVKVNMKS